MNISLSHIFNPMLPHNPTLFGDILFCVMVISIISTICYVIFNILKYRVLVPKVHTGLMLINHFSSVLTLILLSQSKIEGVTHFLSIQEETKILGFCFIISLVYGFSQFLPENR